MNYLMLSISLVIAAGGALMAKADPEAIKHYGAPDSAFEILVRGTTDIALFEPVLLGFIAAEPEISVIYEQWGSNALYARTAADCAESHKPSDLVISSAVDQQVKLVNQGCAARHEPTLPAGVETVSHWRNEVFGITQEPAVIVYNKIFVSPHEAPHSRFDVIDLLRPENSRFAGKVATYDIEASGLGYLFAFMDSQQATTFGSMIEAFARSGAVATCCSAEIIDGVASGEYLIAYNVLGSYALARARETETLVVVPPADYTLVLQRAALIPRGSRSEQAGALLDFILSQEGRELLAAQNLYVDLEELAQSSGISTERMRVAQRDIPLSPVLLVGLDQHKRAQFIDLWRTTFLYSRTSD